MKLSLVCGVAVAALVSSAQADVVISFTNFTAAGFQFSQIATPGSLVGNITGVSVNATLTSSVGFTYADDLCVYIDVQPLSLNGLVQIGGFSDMFAAQRFFWATGDSPAAGTVVSGTATLAPAIAASTPNLGVWLGNGYGATGTSGTWTGTVTLHGVNAAPTPGAIALLGLAGFVARRRR